LSGGNLDTRLASRSLAPYTMTPMPLESHEHDRFP
jgi:hypothetical protein